MSFSRCATAYVTSKQLMNDIKQDIMIYKPRGSAEANNKQTLTNHYILQCFSLPIKTLIKRENKLNENIIILFFFFFFIYLLFFLLQHTKRRDLQKYEKTTYASYKFDTVYYLQHLHYLQYNTYRYLPYDTYTSYNTIFVLLTVKNIFF